MKKLLLLALVAAAIAAPARAVILGASVGYLTDSKEAYFAARGGWDFAKNANVTHIAELEIGYSSQKDYGATADYMPITVNYRLQGKLTDLISLYGGVGAGYARISLSGYGLSDADWALAWQGFAGVSLNVAKNASIDLGARYIWIDKANLFSHTADVGDDVALEAGFHFKF